MLVFKSVLEIDTVLLDCNPKYNISRHFPNSNSEVPFLLGWLEAVFAVHMSNVYKSNVDLRKRPIIAM